MITNLKSCCCFTLEVGVIILGWFDLVVNFILATALCVLIANGKEILDFSATHNENVNVTYSKQDEVSFRVGLGVMLGIRILSIVTAVLLLIGAMKKKRLCMVPYLLMEMVYIGFMGIYTFVLLIFIRNLEGFVGFVLSSIYLAILIYLWLCVYSLYNVYKNEESQTNPTQMIASPYNPNMYQQPPPYPGKA